MQAPIPGELLRCEAITSSSAAGLAKKVQDFLSETVHGGLINFETFYCQNDPKKFAAIILYMPEIIMVSEYDEDALEDEEDEKYSYNEEDE